ncbi:MAG TPA: hypothetical protein VHN39_10665 [Phenylobacterium sp.]|jgi:hypothetical protein|nr:hypothetical protein [Phenylobacterium sp.]
MSTPKLGDFYVGVIGLFSVFLPGGFLMAALVLAVPPSYSAFFAPLLTTVAEQSAAFVFCAYALGALIFLPASQLDSLLYDPYRRRKWPKDEDHAYKLATALRGQVFPGPTDDDSPMNTFAWSQALLLLHAPAAFAEIQRFEAESKFFRSLIIALPLSGMLALARSQWIELPLTVVIAGLCFLRYAERRHKSTEWAYRYAIALQMSPAAIAASSLRAVAA